MGNKPSDYLGLLVSINNTAPFIDEKFSDERRQIHFRNIQIAIDRIQGLIEGVTLVTQSEQGKLPFDPQPLDLKTFCQSTIEQLEAYRETNRIDLKFDDRLANPLNLD